MSLCVKVWSVDEREPPDGQLSNLTTAPLNWFRESPPYAAELYALERWGNSDQKDRRIYVRDDAGKVHAYRVDMRAFFDCDVTVRPFAP